MILPVHDSVRGHIARMLKTLYALDDTALPAIALEYPPNRDLGDLGTPVAFDLLHPVDQAPPHLATTESAREMNYRAS